jgi:hypothetical protein
MKIKYVINSHKAITFIVVLGLMTAYNNYSSAAWVYLALHGTYGLMWLVKDRIYPDKQWEQELSIAMGVVAFILLENTIDLCRGLALPNPYIIG